MSFFLVDVEFRKKAKHLLTTKEIWFCIFFCIFALVPWMDIAVFAGHRLFGRNGTLLPEGFWDDNSISFSDFYDATSADDTPTMEASCSPKFPKLCVTNPWQLDTNQGHNQSKKRNNNIFVRKIFLHNSFLH